MKPLMALPCKNRHSDMEQREKGYHCKSCDHVLTDFRNSTPEEISSTLKANPGKICGVFNRDQFDYKISHVQVPAFRTVGLSLLGILGFLGPVITSCESDSGANVKKQDAFNLLKFPMHIKGTLRDEEGAILRNFKLQILQHDKVIKTGMTDKNGNFDIIIQKGDLDQETFNMVFGKAMVVNDTLPMKPGTFSSGKKVKLTIKAEANDDHTLGIIPPEVAKNKTIKCLPIAEGIIMDEPLAGIPAYDPPVVHPEPEPEPPVVYEGKMIMPEIEHEPTRKEVRKMKRDSKSQE